MNMIDISETKLYDQYDIMKMFDVQKSTIQRWQKEGLKVKSINYCYYVTGKSLLEWVNA